MSTWKMVRGKRAGERCHAEQILAARGRQPRFARRAGSVPTYFYTVAFSGVCAAIRLTHRKLDYSRAETLQEKSLLMPLRISACHEAWSRYTCIA